MDNKPHILLIEDDKESFLNFKNIIEDADHNAYTVQWIEQAEKALDIIAKEHLDCCFVDFKFAHSKAIDFIKQAKKINSHIPYIILTHSQEEIDEINSYKDHEHNYLSILKLSPDTIDMTIRYAMEKLHIGSHYQQQEQLLEMIFETTPRIFAFKDKDLIYRAVNNAFCNFIGKTKEEIIGKSDFDLFPEKEARIYADDDMRVLETCKSQAQEEKVSGNGGLKWLYVEKTPVLPSSGDCMGVLCSVFDISENKRKEESLNQLLEDLKYKTWQLELASELNDKEIKEKLKAQESIEASERNYREIFNASNDAIIVHDMHSGAIIDTNQTAEDILGFTRENFKHMIVSDYSENIYPYTQEEAVRLIHKAINEGIQTFEWRCKTKFGKIIWTEVNLKHVFINNHGRILAVIRDISLRKQQEKAINRKEEMLSTFMDSSTEFFALTDENLKIIMMNKAGINLIGRNNFANVKGKDISIISKNIKTTGRYEAYKKVIKTGNPYYADDAISDLETGLKHLNIKAFKVGTGLGMIISDITEEVINLEKVLFLATITEQITDPVIATDNEGIIISWNESATTLYGYSQKEALGKPISIIFGGDFHDSIQTEIHEHLKELGTLTTDFINKDKNNEQITVSVRLSLLKDSHNNIIGLIGIGRDVSARRQEAQALKESENRMRSLLEHSGAAINFFDLAGTILLANSNSEIFWHKDPETVIGHNYCDYLSEKAANDFRKRIESVVITGHTHEAEDVIKLGSELHWFESRTIPVKNTDNQIIGIQTISRDITNKKLADEELIRINKAINDSSDAICIADRHGQHFYQNKQFSNMFGYNSADELLQLGGNSVLYNNKAKHKQIFQNIMSGDSWVGEVDMRTKDGNDIPILLKANAAKNDEGKIIGLLGIHTDIAEQKAHEKATHDLIDEIQRSKTEVEQVLDGRNKLINDLEESKEQLKSLNSTKDKFFSIIAHDLKSPFSGLLGISKILSDEIFDMSVNDMSKYARMMKESAESVYKLLENLLQWSRIQKGSMDNYPELVIVDFIAKNVLSINKINTEQKEIEVKYNIDKLLYAYVDTNLLQTVIRNLYSNAIKFTPRGGNIEIRSDKIDDDYARVSIIDNGVGIEKAIIGKLFKIETKISTKGTEDEPSTGLGLLLCKDLIELMNGEISVESEVGKGSTFSFTIPLHD